jgi:hypothetical protein
VTADEHKKNAVKDAAAQKMDQARAQWNNAIVRKRSESSTTENAEQECSESSVITRDFEGGYPQKSPHSGIFEGHRAVYRNRKSKKRIGSSGRTRTYSPSVNSRFGGTGVRVFSVTYTEPHGILGANAALSFPNFFPKFTAGSAPLAVEEQALQI